MKPTIAPQRIIITALLVVTLVGGLALMFTGRAAQLGQWRDVTIEVAISEVPTYVETDIAPGDVIYTDPAAMRAGVVDQVTVEPLLVSSPDASGTLQVSPDPLANVVRIVFTTRGRQTDEIIATGNQVVQVGQQFTVFTKSTQLKGTIVRIDVQ